MADTSFADMGKALDDAAAQYQDSNSVSTPDTATPDAGGSGASSEGNPDTPPSAGGDANLPKTDATPVGAGAQQGNPSTGKPTTADDKQSSERKAFNHSQAAARIARKRAKEQKEFYERMQRLKQERDDYANEQSQNHNPQMAALKDDQIREAEIAEAQRLQNQFIEESYEIFQDEATTQEFVQDCKTYADWINTREPQLAEYVQKPLGKLVLKGWFDKIAKVPQAADWWQSLTPFEKYKQLDRYYKEFEAYIAKVQSGEINPNQQQSPQGQPPSAGQTAQPPVQNQQPTQQTQQQPQQVPNIPVPNGGRNTNNMPPTNNFSLELDRAMQANGVSKLVR